MPIQSQTAGYTIVPSPSFAARRDFRVVAPGLRLLGRADSVNMAELMAALDRALVEREASGSPTRG